MPIFSIPISSCSRILESFPEVAILIDKNCELVRSNQKAISFFEDIEESVSCLNALHPSNELSVIIKNLCQLLIDSDKRYSAQTAILQDKIMLSSEIKIYIRVEWFSLSEDIYPHYLLVRLEDVSELSQQKAVIDAFRFQLTQREAEIWQLHLEGYSYKEIAIQSCVTIDTVKKHMKNIKHKRIKNSTLKLSSIQPSK